MDAKTRDQNSEFGSRTSALRHLTLCLLLLLSWLPYSAFSYAPDPTNAPTTVWAVAGVPGGIPNGWSNYTSLGTNATVAQIASAINNCPPNAFVLLTNGTYNLTGPLIVGMKDNWILRGTTINGTNATILKFTTSAATTVDIGNNIGSGSWVNPVGVLSAMQGSNVVVMAAANPNINTGDIICVDELNESWMTAYGSDGTTPGAVGVNAGQMGKQSSDGDTRLRLHIGKVTGKTGNTLTVHPLLPFSFDTNMTPQIYRGSTHGPTNSGIENITFDFSGVPATSHGWDQHPFRLQGAQAFWFKGCEFKKWNNWAALWVLKSSCVEFRGCYFHEPLTHSVDHGYGLQLESSTACLVTDNIWYDCQSNLLIQNGCSGCVIAYNVLAFGRYVNSGHTGEWLQHEINANHTPFPSFNLYEGNYLGQFQADYYYGPSGWGTIFRNRIPGRSSATTDRFMAILIDAYNRYFSVVGNSLGENTNLTSITLALPGVMRSFATTTRINWTYEGAGTDAFGDSVPHIYRLGYPFSGGQGVGTGVQVHDAFVKTNTLRHANWDAYTPTNGGVVYDPTIADPTLSNSLFLTSAPYFFGTNFAWPPYGPSAPISMVNDLEKIPAGWRLRYGTNLPYGELAISSKYFDFGYYKLIDAGNDPPYYSITEKSATNSCTIWITNIGNAPLILDTSYRSEVHFENNPPDPGYAAMVWIGINHLPSADTFVLQPGAATNAILSLSLGNRLMVFPAIWRDTFYFDYGGARVPFNFQVLYLGSNYNAAPFPATNAPKTGAVALFSSALISTESLEPFIPGQSGEAYLVFALTNRSVVTFTAQVKATNAINSIAVAVDGEPVVNYSVWDITTNSTFTGQTLNLRGVGNAKFPDQPANPWLLDTGTHSVKVYFQTAGTAISNLTANVTAIIPRIEITGIGAFSGGTFQ